MLLFKFTLLIQIQFNMHSFYKNKQLYQVGANLNEIIHADQSSYEMQDNFKI